MEHKEYNYEDDIYDDRSNSQQTHNNMKTCKVCKSMYYRSINQNNNTNNTDNNMCNKCFNEQELSLESIVNRMRKYVQSESNNLSSDDFFKQLFEQHKFYMNAELSGATNNLSKKSDQINQTSQLNNISTLLADENDYFSNNLFV